MENGWRFPYRCATAISDGGTQEGRHRRVMDVPVQAGRACGRHIRRTHRLSRDGEGNSVPNGPIPHCREKPLARWPAPVPQTDTGRRAEYPQARERTPVKELGKTTP